MTYLVIAVHGILTRQTDASWPDHFDAWMSRRDPEVKVLKKEYAAGPFPRWNCRVKDPRLARGIVAEVALFRRRPEPGGDPVQVWFVAHSNGAVIALLAARRLAAMGWPVAGLLLTGAACDADLFRNGVLEQCLRGKLKAAVAYAAPDDRVLPGDPGAVRGFWRKLWQRLRGLLLRPYGGLGRTGWRLPGAGRPIWRQEEHAAAGIGLLTLPFPAGQLGSVVYTRWFRGGHGTYFTPENRERTFEQIYRDIVTNSIDPR